MMMQFFPEVLFDLTGIWTVVKLHFRLFFFLLGFVAMLS
jgi:hypothetical protein